MSTGKDNKGRSITFLDPPEIYHHCARGQYFLLGVLFTLAGEILLYVAIVVF